MNFRQLVRLGSEASPVASVQISDDRSSVVRPMARRAIYESMDGLQVTLPRARRRVVFKAGVLQTVGRLLVWLGSFLQFYFGNMLGSLKGQASTTNRAKRLRRILEAGGPTFIKLAQQLSMRADMLPYAYCAELGKMLDRVAAFPTEEAIAIIERNLGRPLEDVFEVFDPDPIGSASLACVYQARLKSGESVAVKVRRPSIGPLIAADLRALDWILAIGETLTIIPAGVTRRFADDLRTILFNEMNFRAEARYTDIFRRRSEKSKKGITAPRVFFEYCTEEVMVSEFVSGVWMWELLQAVDSNDHAFLLKMRQMGIEPKALASKFLRVMQREVQEELFFHADPHPANLVVSVNNQICFIDFGAIGRFSPQTRKTLREIQHHMVKGDIGRMINCALTLIGPLPPLDVEKVRSEMDKLYADLIYAIRSKDAEWWEKSTAQSWLRFLEISRQFSLPASYETIQLFRTTFAYDTIIIRLNKNINIEKEWQAYTRDAAKAARERVRKSLRQRLRGPTDMDYLSMEQFGDMVGQFFFQIQRNIENPIIHFRNIVGKIAYIVSLLLKLAFFVGAGVGLGLLGNVISRRWFGYDIDWVSMLDSAPRLGWVQVGAVLVILVLIRRIVIRLSMPDTRLNSDR